MMGLSELISGGAAGKTPGSGGGTGTTAQFLRGDNTWSNALVGPITIGASAAPIGTEYVPVDPTASANFGLINLGTAGFAGGGGTNFAGSANGTYLGINYGGATYTGNFVDFQANGVSKFSVSGAGALTMGHLLQSDNIGNLAIHTGLNQNLFIYFGAAVDNAHTLAFEQGAQTSGVAGVTLGTTPDGSGNRLSVLAKLNADEPSGYGGITLPDAQAADAAWNMQWGECFLLYNTLTAPRAITLVPANTAGCEGQLVIVHDHSGSCSPTNTLTTSVSGGANIDGSASVPIMNAYGSAMFRIDKNGSYWHMFGQSTFPTGIAVAGDIFNVANTNLSLHSGANGNINFYSGNGTTLFANFQSSNPNKMAFACPIALASGQAAAGNAPLYFQSGTLLTVPVSGAVEYLSGRYYLTGSEATPVRKAVVTANVDNRVGLTAVDGAPIVIYAVPAGAGQMYRITADLNGTAAIAGTWTYTITYTENGQTLTLAVTATVVNTLATATDLIHPDASTNITAQLTSTGGATGTLSVGGVVERLG